MMNWKAQIEANYRELEKQIQAACASCQRQRESLKLIWVSKTQPMEAVVAATQVGTESGMTQVDFGENKVQECVDKFSVPHPQRSLHLIGPLQSNKIRKALASADWIHTVASAKHLAAIERITQEEGLIEAGRQIRILFQVNTSGEASKSGLAPEEVDSFLEQLPPSNNLLYSGLMTIGPGSGNPEDGRRGFQQLREKREDWFCRDERFTQFTELSMGMTGDLQVAIEEGSTMIRVGTALFGARHDGIT
jgi:PLP dependent protein